MTLTSKPRPYFGIDCLVFAMFAIFSRHRLRCEGLALVGVVLEGRGGGVSATQLGLHGWAQLRGCSLQGAQRHARRRIGREEEGAHGCVKDYGLLADAVARQEVIRKEAWSFYRTISGVRLCKELEEPKGPKRDAAWLWRHVYTHPLKLSKSCVPSPFPAGTIAVGSV